MTFKRTKIKSARTFGEILKETRVKKKITLETAEEKTKVRLKYLQALENGDFITLPTAVYTLGFLSKYVDFLNLNKEDMITRFNREKIAAENINKQLAPARRIRENHFFITTKTLIGAAIGLAICGAIWYGVYSFRQFALPPNLIISAPATGQAIRGDKTEIVGKTDIGVTLLINNENVVVDNTGNFREAVQLNPGLNTFEIRVINQLKKENSKTIKIMAES